MKRLIAARGLLVQVVERVVDVLIRVQRAVEHDRAGLAREQALDRGAEEGAVREAQVGHLLVADRLADRVEVTRDVRRRHVLQVLVALDAAPDVARVLT
jgi:hypothetical protein